MARADWFTYQSSIGDRTPVFRLVAERWNISSVLYLGSYVDLAPSIVWPDVTYVDTDVRARKFFADEELVAQQLKGRDFAPKQPQVTFVPGDFNADLPLEPRSYDLVISLFSGPSLGPALRYARSGGFILVNNSHADASLAALEQRLTPAGCVVKEDDQWILLDTGIEDYFAFKQRQPPTVEKLMATGRGATMRQPSFCQMFSVD